MSILTLVIPLVIPLGIVFGAMPLAPYQTARIDAIIHPNSYGESYNYIGMNLRRLPNQFTMGGSHDFELPAKTIPTVQMHTDYAVTSMFSWFGIIVGCAILGVIFLFCIYSFYISIKQNNRISFLFGVMCSMTLLIRCVFYVLNNLGLFLNYSTYFPFLKYEIGNAIVNGCYIGIIMCVYRNSNILTERTILTALTGGKRLNKGHACETGATEKADKSHKNRREGLQKIVESHVLKV